MQVHRRLIALAAFALVAGLALAPAAEASHFRGANITWTAGGGNTIEFTIRSSWRRSNFTVCRNTSTGLTQACSGGDGYPNVGDVVAGVEYFYFGDSSNIIFDLLVTSADPTTDMIEGLALNPAQYPTVDTSIPHTYASPGTYTAYISDCCRISTAVTNADGDFIVQTDVTVGTGNEPPVSSMPAIVNCVVNTTCNFLVPASDPDADPITFRLATLAESSLTQPTGASINATTGTYSWDTTGMALGYYPTQVIVEDDNGASVAVDFMINVIAAPVGVAPAFDAPPTPACGSTINAIVGQEVSFTIQASDADNGDSVTLSASGVPAGATFDPALPTSGSPVSTDFAWTPDASGNTIVTFTAQDTTQQQALCSITIAAAAAPTGPLPADVPAVDPAGLAILASVLLLAGLFAIRHLR